MPSLLHYFTFGTSNKDSSSDKPTPIRALPASWYNSQAMFDFERRAIFSRRWLFLTHSSRLKQTGDWLRFNNVAGFDFILTRDKTGSINAFHNVCRHRAYPVIEDENAGNKKIIACRYHGWSYGLNGKLAKAPGYQDLEFNKEDNGLFTIHTHTDSNGFIYVNLDASPTPQVPWSAHFDAVDHQARYSHLDFSAYDLHHTFELDCSYNWKIAADNFNECYHCPTTHPDIPAFLNLESFDSETRDGHIQHRCESTEEQLQKGLDVHSTYYFPNVSMMVSPHFMMIQKFHPMAPSQTLITYEVYKNRHSSDADFALISDMYERVMREDKILCNAAQANLNRGVFVNGQLHPRWEKAPLFFQNTVREVVTEHFAREKEAGCEIWPAQRKAQGNVGRSEEDEEICRAIECFAKSVGMNRGGAELLAW